MRRPILAARVASSTLCYLLEDELLSVVGSKVQVAADVQELRLVAVLLQKVDVLGREGELLMLCRCEGADGGANTGLNDHPLLIIAFPRSAEVVD